ncbi:hypothetical protein GCM10028820_26190 [Tessaracoccus terricola]
MRNFFEQMEPWARNDGSLHLYVLPDEEVGERLAEVQSLFEDVPGLPAMPRPYLHLTLQRLAQFDDELKQAELSRLGATLTEALARVAPFDLTLGAPAVEETAVVSTAAASAEWDALHAAVVSGVTAVLTDELPSAPHAPHVTLAYAIGDVPDADASARLAAIGPVGTLRVSEVHLVSVTIRPEVGIFDFTHLANWSLAG